jgi:phage-related protein
MANDTLWEVVFYEDVRGHRPVNDWLSDLDAKARARIVRTVGLLEKYGTQLGMPHSRHLRGKLWELRIGAGRRDYRVISAAFVLRQFVLLHGFTKQTAKTPARELEIAERRFVEYLSRHPEGG